MKKVSRVLRNCTARTKRLAQVACRGPVQPCHSSDALRLFVPHCVMSDLFVKAEYVMSSLDASKDGNFWAALATVSF